MGLWYNIISNDAWKTSFRSLYDGINVKITNKSSNENLAT